MPKSRGRKKAKSRINRQGRPGPMTPTEQRSQPQVRSAASLWTSLELQNGFDGAVEIWPDVESADQSGAGARWSGPAGVVSPFERTPPEFSVRIGGRLVEWPFWPGCIAATKSGERCTWTACPGAPGPRDPAGFEVRHAYLIDSEATYGSRQAETLRRLLTQRCHSHDGADVPDAIAFQGRPARGDQDWLEPLRQQAKADATRAAATRRANRQLLAATECPTCGVIGALKCVTNSGKTAENNHRSRIQAAFGDGAFGIPVV